MLFLKSFKEPLTRQEEIYYVDKYLHGDDRAREILIEKNMRLVAHIAKKYRQDGKSMEELISVGTIGLVKAVNNFNADKGRLATFASRCIENEILMMFRNDRKHSKEISLFESLGKDKDGNDVSLIDLIESDDEQIYEKCELKQNIEKLNRVFFKTLNRRERYIICHRYGIYNCEIYTQNRIAHYFGISRSYVSRIEKKALEKLKRSMEETL